MREILFRGKRIDNGEWVEGFYVLCRGHHYILQSCDIDHGFDERYCDWIEIDFKTLCQYTGLNDKDGHCIFENDILDAVDYRVRKGVVKFGLYKQCDMASDYECGNQGFYVWFDVKKTLRPDIYYWHGNSAVVGNIFDNPELVKGGDETEDRS